MTDREIKKARMSLPPRTQVPWSDWTEEQKQASKELDCRDMINSLLVYHGEDGVKKGNYFADRYLFNDTDYINDLGVETIERLCEEQLKDFRQAVVHENVHTDNEGVSYNSITWADEVSLEEKLATARERCNEVLTKLDDLKVTILQVKNGGETRFERFSPLRYFKNGVEDVKFKNYDIIYSYNVENKIDFNDKNSYMAILEDVYQKFNVAHPEDYTGRSLSVSDVVVLSERGMCKAFYCDSVGFEELPEGFVEEFKKSIMPDKDVEMNI